MRLQSLRIANYRSCDDLTVSFDRYTCLVGQNGSGKSTILSALNVLFRNAAASPTPVLELTEEDFCCRNTAKPIVITATFSELTPTEQADFQAYYRQDALIISAKATWDTGSQKAEVRQYGARMVMKDFAPWFVLFAANAKAPELKTAFAELIEKHPDLTSATSKSDMEASLRAYEESHAELCEQIESEDQFYGWSRGENRLRKYFQYVFIPAVKEAQSEQTEAKSSALGELLQRTIRAKLDFETPIKVLKAETDAKYRELIDSQQNALGDATKALQSRLQHWAHPDAKLKLEWQFDPSKSVALSNPVAKALVGEGAFLGEVSRLGHGLQRSFIVALLQELAAGSPIDTPTLLLGFEEPELYQHPPQAQHLSTVLQSLAEDNAQVVVATHSPHFISGRSFESVRLLRRSTASGTSTCSSLTMDRISRLIAESLGKAPVPPTATMAAIEQILQPSQRELVFCGLPVLVEGQEDIAFIATYMNLRGSWSDFRRVGGHFVVAGGKTNLSRPLAIANELQIPAYVVFDGDSNLMQPQDVANNKRDNGCLLSLCGVPTADPHSSTTIGESRVTMWGTNIGDAVRSDVGADKWRTMEEATRVTHGFSGVRGKNSLLVSATLEAIWDGGGRSAALDGVCKAILARAVTV
jgi:putative ATP-dependent endonuclease of OLD family